MVFSLWTESVQTRIVKSISLNRLPVVYRSLQIVVTFSLVSFAWIFFRANSLSDAIYISLHLFSGYDGGNAALISEQTPRDVGSEPAIENTIPSVDGI